jgi:hypothetical protein
MIHKAMLAIDQGILDLFIYIDHLPDSVFATAFIGVALIVMIGSWLFPKT